MILYHKYITILQSGTNFTENKPKDDNDVIDVKVDMKKTTVCRTVVYRLSILEMTMLDGCHKCNSMRIVLF